MALRSLNHNLFAVDNIDALLHLLHAATTEVVDDFWFMISEFSIPTSSPSFFVTVTTQVACISPALAVIVAVPAARAVTTLCSSTVATVASEVLQAKSWRWHCRE